MPTYAYRCKSCSFELEEFQRLNDPPLVKCPSCHKDTLVRIISAGAGLVFKGSGFYLTDYKRKSTSGSAPSEKKKKPESKPDAGGKDSSPPKTHQG